MSGVQDDAARESEAVPVDASEIVCILLAHRGKLDAKLSTLATSLAKLRAEHDEITSALAVIDRHVEAARVATTPVRVVVAPNVRVTDPAWRPPSMPTMIFEVLANGPMTSREMLKEVRRRFVPDVRADAVAPTAARLVRGGRLSKLGRHYFLPEAPAD